MNDKERNLTLLGYDQSKILDLLMRPGYIPKALYLLSMESYHNSTQDAYVEFLLGIALCNARLDIYLLTKFCSAEQSCLEQMDRGFKGKNPPFADPQMLFYGYQHFCRGYQLGCHPETWEESYDIQRQTAELLLAFIVNEQKDSHMSSLKISGTPFRVLQLAYLCLAQLAPQFIPLEYELAKNYKSFIEWARNYSIKDV